MRTQSDCNVIKYRVCQTFTGLYRKYLNLIKHTGFYRYTAASENNSKNCMLLFDFYHLTEQGICW